MNHLHDRISRWTTRTHVIATLLAFAAFRVMNIILDASYARSKFPVPFQEGQTAFSGELIKSYYQVMIDKGTLPIYWQTQFIDFGFIAAFFAFGLLMPLLVRRLFQRKTLSYRFATAAAWLIPIGTLFDALENFASFAMLAQPHNFPDWIAPIYSSLAVIKFAAIGLGFICVLLSLLIGGSQWLYARITVSSKN